MGTNVSVIHNSNHKNLKTRRILAFFSLVIFIITSSGCTHTKAESSPLQTTYQVFESFTASPLLTDMGSGDVPSTYVTACTDRETIDVLVYQDSSDGVEARREYSILRYDHSGTCLSKTKLEYSAEDMEIVLCMEADLDGNIVIASQIQTIAEDAMAYTDTKTKLTTFLATGVCKCDPVIITQNFVDGWTKILMDSECNLYVLCASEVFVFNSKGEVLYSIKDQRIGSEMLLIGNEVYVECVEYPTEARLKSEYILLDPVKKGFGSSIDMTKYESGGMLLYGCQNGLFSANEEGIFAYDFSARRMIPILNFRTSDFKYSSDTDQIFILSKDTILIRRASEDGSITIMLVTADKTKVQDVRKEITLGGIGLSSYPELLSEVKEFNKNNSDFHILLKDYSTDISTIESADVSNPESRDETAKTFLALDLLSDTPPDILISDDSLPMTAYEKQGLFTDLYTYFKTDNEFVLEDYETNILKAYETDGKLYRIGTKYIISGLAGKASVIGDRTGWTFEDFNQTLQELPEGMKMLYPNQTKANVLTSIYSFNQKNLFDSSNLKTNFVSDEFIRLLQFANTYGVDEINVTDDYYESFQKYALMSVPIRSFSDYIDLERNFGESIPVLGYPSSMSSSASFSFPFCISISSKSNVSEGAWQFIRFLLSAEQQKAAVIDESSSSYYLPLCRATLQEEISLSLHPTEENKANYAYIGLYQSEPLNEETEMRFMHLIDSLNTLNVYSRDIDLILQEEAAPFFAGQKSEQEVTAILQNRLQILFAE